jgi:hypothetical protein
MKIICQLGERGVCQSQSSSSGVRNRNQSLTEDGGGAVREGGQRIALL